MKQTYEKAFAEIDDILNLMPTQLKNKIPIKFRNMIRDKKSVDYKPNIKEPFEEQELMEETTIILGLIYRDFLCDEEEKRKLKAEDAQNAKELEEELREKYNPDNIFKNKNDNNTFDEDIPKNEETSIGMQMVEYKEPIFKRIVNKILEFLHVR